jgi:predicted nucleotidyltransferase
MSAMAQYRWDNCPQVVREQVNALLESFREFLGEGLVGLYLHGSLAMGCFNPQRSDLDLLAATQNAMTADQRRCLVHGLLRSSGRPAPVEITFLTAEDRAAWRHPLPYDFHYSETRRTRYQQDLISGAWVRWKHAGKGDPDLAGKLTILRERGTVLWGPPIEATFPAVPREDYLASILARVDPASQRYDVQHDPAHVILNLCRGYAFARDGLVISKDEAGAWAIQNLEVRFRPMVGLALACYRGDRPEPFLWPQEPLRRFVRAVWRRIQASQRAWSRRPVLPAAARNSLAAAITDEQMTTDRYASRPPLAPP